MPCSFKFGTRMINIRDLYSVLSAMVPLYAAMFLAYASVRWWKIFTSVQCSGINRFVAVFAVPLLSFHFISSNNPYHMDGRFILADTISKLAILILLAAWAKFARSGSLDWTITIFALASLPNTLVMGIPLLSAMYGSFYGGLMVQLVVLQCIVWYTIMLFLFEFRAACLLITEQFPDVAASIISFKVDSDVLSLDGKEPLETQADVGEDGKVRVSISRSNFDRTQALTSIACPRSSFGFASSMPNSSKAITPRPSNMTGAEIYSVYSSRNNTPRQFFDSGNGDNMHNSLLPPRTLSPRHSSFTASDIFSVQSSHGPTPRTSNVNEEHSRTGRYHMNNEALRVMTRPAVDHNHNLSWPGYGASMGKLSPKAVQIAKRVPDRGASLRFDDDGKELHMFVWSSTTSPMSEAGHGSFGSSAFGTNEGSISYHQEPKEVHMHMLPLNNSAPNADCYERLNPPSVTPCKVDEFSFDSQANKVSKSTTLDSQKQNPVEPSSSGIPISPKANKRSEMPPAGVIAKLILQMVGRKLIRNPNTYSSLIGLGWSLIAFRWGISMPMIILNSIKILADAGLGMAMFSLGLFMALQPKLIACGTSLAVLAMVVRFLTGPAVMAASSIAVGLRGVDLHAAIVQAALPQGIVPFVFAREYDLHPDILSTGVIFGMLVALPTTLLYYVLLGL